MAKEPFSIEASTYTILPRPQTKNGTNNLTKSLIEDGRRYQIPVYQRPYSWGKKEVRKLVNDLFRTFQDGQEPLFIGTMQLKPVSENCYEIIDGQQRTTTMLILLWVLKEMGIPELEGISFGWLSTKVGIDAEQNKLRTFLASNLESLQENTHEAAKANRYIGNAKIIFQEVNKWKAQFTSPELHTPSFDGFHSWLTLNVYFVVIQTQAGLSKTLQIFDAINTTGLDLGGADLFKIRMFEYLVGQEQKTGDTEFETKVFTMLNGLYQLVERCNEQLRKLRNREGIIFSINNILRTYQLFLISKHGLPIGLYSLNHNTFFTRLFDQLMNLNDWEDFRSVGKDKKDVVLEAEDVKRLIESRFLLESDKWNTLEEAFSLYQIWHSRYPHFYDLILLYYDRFYHSTRALNAQPELVQTQAPLPQEVGRLIIQLSKYYYFKSMQFSRKVYSGQKMSHDLLAGMLREELSENQVLEKASSLIQGDYEIPGNGKNELERLLDGELAGNHGWKYLTCRLCALLEEGEEAMFEASNKGLRFLFWEDVDVEHIRAIKSKAEQKGQDPLGPELHKLGNLVLLERAINRNIKAISYAMKAKKYLHYPWKNRKKNQKYLGSQLRIVRRLAKNFDQSWSKCNAEERRKKLTTQIVEYIIHGNISAIGDCKTAFACPEDQSQSNGST